MFSQFVGPMMETAAGFFNTFQGIPLIIGGIILGFGLLGWLFQFLIDRWGMR
jgi:hypothetical protein